MQKGSFKSGLKRRYDSFTLIELLVVMAIIGILAALTIAAGEGVMSQAARSRGRTEIKAMGTALENYKADNGSYFQTNTFSGTNTYASTDGTVSGGLYQEASQGLYQALSGKTNFEDVPTGGVKTYFPFKANQLGNANASAGTAGSSSTYIEDPWGNSYGYCTGDTNNPPQYPPNNGSGFYDLWATGGILSGNATANPTLTNSWISNWQP